MLAHKTAYASLVLIITRLITRFSDLITLLVLAHELKPADFGLVALAMSLMLIAESIFELPVADALLRLDHLERSHLDTAFTISLLRSLAVMLGLCLLAWPFALFYQDPRLVPLILLLSLGQGMRGLQSPELIGYAKALSFWRSSVIELSGKAMSLLIAVSLVLITHSYWAIPAGTVAAPVTTVAVSFCVAPYRPRFSLANWRYFANFFGWTSLGQIIKSVNWQSDIMFLGRIAGSVELGLFTTASNLSSIPLFAVLGPIYRPLLASLASVKNDPAKLRRAYQLTSTAAITIGLPMLVGESLLAKQIIQVLLGPHWLAAARMMNYLALSIIPGLFALPFGPMVIALNQAQYFVHRNMFEFFVKLPILIIAGLTFGLFGIIAARVISEIAVAIYCAVLARRLIGIGIYRQIMGPWRSVVSTLFMAAGVTFLNSQLHSLSFSIPPILLLAFLTCAGGAIYMTALALLWHYSGRPAGIEHLIHQNLSRLARIPLAKSPPQEVAEG
jgi:O-antigen/teichoic acid export membrane protein